MFSINSYIGLIAICAITISPIALADTLYDRLGGDLPRMIDVYRRVVENGRDPIDALRKL